MVRRAFSSLIAVLVLTALPAAARAQTTEAPKPAGPTFTPYGFILLNAFFSSRAFAADDYPQYAVAPGATNDRSFLLSNRYNRIGIRVGGLEAMGAKLGGVLEMDFGFGFAVTAGSNVTQSTQATNFDFYRPLARMRLGFVTATWESPETKFVLLLGQDYALVNPLFAVTLGYIGTPLFQNAGNLYTRSPMVKLSADLGKTNGITLQAAAMDPMDQNIVAGTGQNQETPTLSSGNRARTPQLEGRVAARYKTTPDLSGEIGVSGSWHKERYILGTAVTTTVPNSFTPNGRFVDLDSAIGGVDAVLRFPFIEVRGEGFLAHNADMYYGHLGQGGVNFVTSGNTVTNALNKRTKGFWVQGIVSPVPELQLTGGYGAEVPFGEDIVVGNRSRNSMASVGVIVSATKNLKFSAEAAYTYTSTKGTAFDTSLNGYQTVLSSQFLF